MSTDLNGNSSQTADEWLKETYGALSGLDEDTRTLAMKASAMQSNREDILNLFSSFGWEPTIDEMCAVAAGGKIETVKWMQKKGVNINALCSGGVPPIFAVASSAVLSPSEQIVAMERLMALGARLDVKSDEGKTIVEFADSMGKTEAAEWSYRKLNPSQQIKNVQSSKTTQSADEWLKETFSSLAGLDEATKTLRVKDSAIDSDREDILNLFSSFGWEPTIDDMSQAATMGKLTAVKWMQKKLNQSQQTKNVQSYDPPAHVAPKQEISNLEKAKQELEIERQKIQKKSSSPIGAILVLLLLIAGIGAYFYFQPNVKKLIDSGMAHYEAKNFTDAINYFTRAIQIEPNNPELYFRRGDAHDANKAYHAAIADYTQAIQLDPNDARFWNNRGGTFRAMENYAAAINDYNEAIRLNPNDARYRNNRGVAYHLSQNYEAAIAAYSEAIQLAPDNARYRNNRGQVHSLMRNHAAAAEDFREAVRLEPDSEQYRTNLERAQERAQRQRQQQRRQ